MNMLWKSWKLGQYVSLRVRRTLLPLFVFPLSGEGGGGGGQGATARTLPIRQTKEACKSYAKYFKAKVLILNGEIFKIWLIFC